MWTGREVIVVGGLAGGTKNGLVDGARYEPGADKWHSLPPFAATAHTLDSVATVWTGDRLVVADLWATTQPIDNNGSSATSGIDVTTYDPASNEWSAVPASPQTPTGIQGLFWTGTHVLAPAAQRWCGRASCPSSPYPPGAQLDLDTNAWTPISAGPIDDGIGTNAWTGAALLRTTMTMKIGDPTSINPGDSAVWDPAANTWTKVQPIPVELSPTTSGIWTGRDALFWGDIIESGTGTATSGGLRFSP